jgi:CDP-glucose 4,6-dehydratase
MLQELYGHRRVLITGHTGFKGAWLSFWLLQMKAEVAGFSTGVPTQPSLFEILELSSRMRHVLGDIRDLASVKGIILDFRPDFVFHLAAQSLVRVSYDEPKFTFDTNLGGTVNVLEALRSAPFVKAAVIVTTDKCYENLETGQAYRENDPLGGNEPYSASKACAELAVRAYARFLSKTGPAVATARAGNVIGGGDWARDRIIPDCITAWTHHQAVQIRQPQAIRPWQFVLEPLRGYLRLGANLLNDAECRGDAFNFGPDASAEVSVLTLVEELQKDWPGGKWYPEYDNSKREAFVLRLNSEKAARRLGWRPVLSWTESVAMTSQWYRRFCSETGDIIEFSKAQLHDYEERCNLP